MQYANSSPAPNGHGEEGQKSESRSPFTNYEGLAPLPKVDVPNSIEDIRTYPCNDS
jgi:hypothetical protein